MIRIKVIKGSQLALGAVAVLLVIVLAVLAIRMMVLNQSSTPTLNWQKTQVTPVETAAIAQENAAVAAFSVETVETDAPDIKIVEFDLMPTDAPEALTASRGDILLDENEHTDRQDVPEMQVEILPEQTVRPLNDGEKPQVLIYHTHTHEAYEQIEGDRYVETGEWRTADPEYSVVRVGTELTKLLEERGFEVIHDLTDHEPPRLGTAYTRSLKTLESYADQHFDLYIDLHRDAYSKANGNPLYVETPDGQAARLMVLIGNGKGQGSVTFDVKPFYQENLAFGQRLTTTINQLVPGLCRDVMVKTGRYNQHIGKNAILIEVGHNKNTLEQALNAMPTLADAFECLFFETGSNASEAGE